MMIFKVNEKSTFPNVQGFCLLTPGKELEWEIGKETWLEKVVALMIDC